MSSRARGLPRPRGSGGSRLAAALASPPARGWASTSAYAVVWTGDSEGNWKYIAMQVRSRGCW